tara:strand:+ start:127 stop:345 length:219 start_codon:yes stop_codon:yes gene_type:complete
MIRWYWGQRRGALLGEFMAVRKRPNNARRLIDRIIIPDGNDLIAKASDVQLLDRDVIVIQTKATRNVLDGAN